MADLANAGGKGRVRSLQRTYNEAIQSLQNLQIRQQDLLESINETKALEQLLLELLETQEAVMELLQKWSPLLQDKEQQQQQQSLQQRLEVFRASNPPRTAAATSKQINNCIRMLQAASEAEVLFAASLSAQDWRQYSVDIFHKAVLLLELANRPNLNVTAHDGSNSATKSADKTAADALATGTAVAAESAIASADPQVKLPVPNNSAWHELESLFDEYSMFGLISLLTNPNAMLEACAANLVTGEHMVASQDHMSRVVRKVNPTDEQLLHMKIVTQLLERMEQHNEQRATPLLQMVMEEGSELQSWGTGVIQPNPAATAIAAGAAGVVAKAAAAKAAVADAQGAQSAASAAPLPPPNSEAAVPAAEPAAEGLEGGSVTAVLPSNVGMLLEKCIRNKQLNQVALGIVVNNTFSRLQSMVGLVAVFPFGPLTAAFAQASAQELEQKRQQQRKQHLQQQQQQQRPNRRDQRPQPGQQQPPTAFPSVSELVRRDAEQHMRQRQAELDARQELWSQMFLPA